MIYGDQKSREMARSILPSTSRSSDAWRSRLHRAARQEARRSLRALTNSAEAWDDGLGFGERSWREISGFVAARRAGDKLNHFIRWAAARSHTLAPHERLGSLRAALPDGLIGEHALDHLRRDRRFAPLETARPRWERRSIFLDRGLLTTLLRRLLDEPGGVRCLHQCLKVAQRRHGNGRVAPGPLRLLGHPQVPSFLDALENHRVARVVVNDFCRAYHRTGSAALAASVASRCVALPLFDWEWRR